jgi:hypothetical protein
MFAALLLMASKIKAGEGHFQVEGEAVELVFASIDPQQVTFAEIIKQPAKFSAFSPSETQHHLHLFLTSFPHLIHSFAFSLPVSFLLSHLC